MKDEPQKLDKEVLKGRIERLRKASKFFRDHNENLKINMYRTYTLKYCDLVDGLIDMIEGVDPDLVQVALDIFPDAKVAK